ncbi:MAG: hypothetical protein M3Y05_17235, partial [Gemmatimonadota bacterium]|nr:hypothetical protein [Gemmatimonadota bacterium]
MRKILPSLVLGSALLVYVAACSDSPAGPGTPGGTCSGSTFALGPLQGRTVSAADLPCMTIAPDGGTYLIVPQFATADAPLTTVTFKLSAGSPAGAAANVVAASKRISPVARKADLGQLQRSFDGILRQRERTLSAGARTSGSAGIGPLASRVRASVAPPATTTFKVRNSLTGSGTTLDTANLRYSGTHLLIYVSKNAPGPANGVNGFSDAQIAAFGNTFDLELYTIDVATFGAPTDIDANGHVIVLLSPLINKLTDRNVCTTQGYIAGFFDATDLLPASYPAASNGEELFYALVPDPAATFSCAHSIAAVEQLTPSTFIHEFQHMISFGQHSIIRGGNDEDPWINEGLSHIAEELGSRYYENRFPPPSGRTDPGQAFPDSSQGFITGDLYNSYHYLLNPASTDSTDKASVSNWGTGDGTLVQRGGAWLFLRWLGDQQDSLVYGRLDQTSNTGVANIQAASGTPFPTLFGEFALALYTDSLPGIPRASIPAAYRFTSRNLRALYAKQSMRNPNDFQLAFPIPVSALTPSSTATEAMYPGTMDYFILNAPASGSNVVLTFAPATGPSFNSSLGAQVSVFRCPSSAACPLSVQ